MLFLYNLLQILLLLLCLPCLALVVLLVPKYRGRTGKRLGCGLSRVARGLPEGRPRIWVHALSVGEVASVRTLLQGLRSAYPEGVLILTVATTSGQRYAESVLGATVDLLHPFPLDLYWSVSRFLRLLNPDLFLLVETDLWPNFLSALRRREVNALLINGRISAASLAQYRRFRRLFLPLFGVFAELLMQSGAEAEKLAALGVAPTKLRTLGNLKYGSLLAGAAATAEESRWAELRGLLVGRVIWVAGSTHAGEEVAVLEAYRQLRTRFPELYLILAPRNPGRAGEVAALAGALGLQAVLRSASPTVPGDLLLLDTMGELAGLYRYCEVAFVGGSLVPERGHNPLEPAMFGRPVVFGPFMEDFAEIAGELLNGGAARQVADQAGLVEVVSGWLADAAARQAAGNAGSRLVAAQRGVTERYLAAIQQYLPARRRP